jgi:ABC-type transport system substrate-binding protein
MTFQAPDNNCKQITVDFIVRDSDPELAAVEDDIRQDLAKIGIQVNTRFLDAETYIETERNGDYNMLFTRTWGAPYDPHSYMMSWAVPSHVEYSAIGGLEAPLTRERLLEKIEEVQTQVDPHVLQEQWREILDDIHQQAMFLPLWGTRVPYVLNRRLGGFVPSSQTYAYPLESVRVLTGSANVTVAPGSGGGLFKSIGPINPHQYFPNELFAQSWVYEGLVSYGQDGEISPALAMSWQFEDLPTGGQRVTFQLRSGVKFHDGSDFNCAVAKLNFDHVLSDVVKERHSWYGTPKQLSSWTCNENDDFVLETKEKFYPLLQELTYIRPLVFASTNSFSQGLDSSPDEHNSCESGDFGSKWDYLEDSVTCAGLSAPIGTGPFKYVSRESTDESTDQSVLFARHDDYWGTVPEIEFLEIKHFDSTDEVEAALLSGDLDMALGIGPLTAAQVQDLKFFHSDVVDVRHSDVLQHAILVMNTIQSPTQDVNVRKAIIHAIDKSRFIEEEFAGLEQPVSQLLPQTAPFCNVDLTPKWSYDFDKAELLHCPADTGGLSTGGIAGLAVGGVVVLGLLALVIRLIHGEKKGTPLFAPDAKAEPA